jgi:hypothetical protein
LLRILSFCAAAGVVSLLWSVPTSAAAGRPLLTSITDDLAFASPDASLAFARTKAAGATFARLGVNWGHVAPEGSQKPAGFDGSDPSDPRYDFAELDREVRLAVANGLEPVVGFSGAPAWAQNQSPHPSTYDGYPAGAYKPSPAEVGAFAHALAVRYGGAFEGLPRVRYWRLWNEPNLVGFLSPQFEHGKPFAPVWYRKMLDAFAQAVHGVRADNAVVAGSLAPFSLKSAAMGPLQFMRSLLCLSGGKTPKPACSQRSPFDAFAVHPYTSGGPTHHATNANDLSVGDLPEARRLLDAATRYHHVVSGSTPQLWVTEFSWDTRPPDPNPLAAPLSVQSRWTAEALYRMWEAGVSVVTWFLLRDLPWPGSEFQSGLYFRSGLDMQHDVPKPTLTAFRFPFVAFPQKGGTFVWGRTPGGRPVRVIVEQRRARSWRRLATIRADEFGIFSAVLKKRIGRPPPRPQPSVLTTYQAAVLQDEPDAYWRLGDSGATARDLTGRHEGEAEGGVTFGAPGALRNDSNTAVCLNGTDGRIDLGPLASPSSVEVWVKTKALGDVPFFSNRAPTHQYVDVGSFLHLPHVFDGYPLLGERPVANNQWHQVVYTYAGITGKVYVDGTLQGVNTWPRPTGTSDASLGFDAALKAHLKGCLDEVSLYDKVLAAARVRAHFLASGRMPLPDPSLGALRARWIGSKDASLPFSLKAPRDRYVLPFGG